MLLRTSPPRAYNPFIRKIGSGPTLPTWRYVAPHPSCFSDHPFSGSFNGEGPSERHRQQAPRASGTMREESSGELALGGPDEQYALLMECVTDYAIFLMDGDGRVAAWNAGAERIF